MSPNRRHLNPMVIFGAVLLVIVLGTVLFALFYSGGGLPLSGTAPTPVPTATPIPTPTPAPSAARLFPYKVGNKWGYKDETGKVKIEPQFEKAQEFYEGLAFVAADTNGQWKYGAIRAEDGSYAVQPIFNDARRYSEGLAPVKMQDLWGYADTTGKIVIDATYSSVGDFSQGFAKVMKEGKFGYIDKTGAVIAPFDYLEAQDFALLSNGRKLAVVGSKDATGVMRYNLIEAKTSSTGVVKADIVTSIGAALGTKFSEDFLTVRIGTNQYAYYGESGSNAFGDKTFEAANSFSEGFAAAKQDGKWGFIDKTGEFKTLPKYEEVQDFSDGMAGIKELGKWGYLDSTGAVAIPNRYDEVWPFENGYALVRNGINYDSLSKESGIAKNLYVLENELPLSPESAAKTGTVKLDSGSLNIRSAPDRNAELVMKLANGTAVTIIGNDGDWVKVESDGKSGYCQSQYIIVN